MKNYSLLSLSLILIALSCTAEKGIDRISLEERKILVNESPYFIKGICYNPVAKGDTLRDFKPLTEDLALMKEAGINTIRVYSPIEDQSVLDEIDQAGLKVIIGFGYNQEGKFDILSGSFIDYVNSYKDHNAVLMWELGNEYNYHPEWFENDLRNWYKAMNEAAKLIHQNDPNHPVTTAHGDLPDSLALRMGTEIDVWGMNVYRWDDPSDIFKEWEVLSDKPMYLAEAGGDSYMTISKSGYEEGENELAQADATRKILESVFKNQSIGSGVTLFAFSDELWKAGNPGELDPGGWAPNSSGVPYDGTPNEEYWGIVDVDRNKKLAFEVVREAYNQ